MAHVRITFRSSAAILGFVVLMLCALALTGVAIVFWGGAPHALPSMPGAALVVFLVAALVGWLGVRLLRVAARAAATQSLDQGAGPVAKKVYAIAGGILVLSIGAIAFPFVYAPWWPASGSVPRGAYMLEPTLTSSCAQDAHRIFYGRRVVTKAARDAIISPRNPKRLLYTVACASNGSESGVFYFDPSLGRPVQANPSSLYEIPRDIDLYWSPDDRFVVVPSYWEATLVDLQTGHRSEELNELFAKKGATSSAAYFLGWSPDGKKMAMRVHSSYWNYENRTVSEEQQLISVDPETLAPSYVAELPKGAEVIWVVKDGAYEPALRP